MTILCIIVLKINTCTQILPPIVTYHLKGHSGARKINGKSEERIVKVFTIRVKKFWYRPQKNWNAVKYDF